MNRRSRWFAKLSTTLLLVLLGAVLVAFAPTQLGGQAAFVIVNGNSMEPLYHRGDLVILRTADDYPVGDIVTYRHPQIGPVIHRIIGRDAERFVFRGDHNNFIDPYRPIRSELIGKAWIFVPSVGNVIEQLRKPLSMAILAAVAGVLIMAPMIIGANHRAPRKRGRRQAGQPRQPALSRRAGNNEGLLMALAALACAALALGAFAFTRPTTREASDEITYQQTGVFSYSAAAPAGVYDSNTIQTGEPLFPQLTSAATIGFDYRLVSDRPADLRGTYRLVAEVSAANGWQRTVELRPATSFSGGAFSASGTLDFANIKALIDRFEQQTGLKRQQYTLAVVPEVVVNGTLAGLELHDEYAPRLEFRLDETQVQLQKPGSGAQDPLKPSKDGMLKGAHTEPNTIALLFLKLEVPVARWIAPIVLALALCGTLALGLPILRTRPDEAARIAAKYGALLVAVADGDQPPGARVVAIATIDDLARLAERGGQIILHEASGTRHRYIVQDAGTTYCYKIDGPARVHDAVAEPPHTPIRRDPVEAPQQLLDQTSAEAPPPAQWQSAFLEALRTKSTVSEACRTVGVKLTTVYEEREQVPAFAQAWDEARAHALMAMSEAIYTGSGNKAR